MRYNTDATARGSQDVRSGGRLDITPQVRQKSSRTERIMVKLEAWALHSQTYQDYVKCPLKVC